MWVTDCVSRLPVATGFPAGQTPLETRLQEVRLAVADGATEIDIVINRALALTGEWEGTLSAREQRTLAQVAHIVFLFLSGFDFRAGGKKFLPG